LRGVAAVDIHRRRMSKLEDSRELPKLPSVRMALLPHEVRAARARTVFIIGAAAAAVLGGGAVLALPNLLAWSKQAPEATDAAWPSEQRGASAPAVLLALADAGTPVAAITTLETDPSERETQATDEVADEPAAQGTGDVPLPEVSAPVDGVVDNRTRKPFGQARGFRDALVKGGASGEDADAITDALSKLVNFRRCRPEDELIFERNGAGQLVAFEYRPGVTERYRAERSDGAKFVGKRVEVPIEYRRIARGGYISNSLGRAVEALSLGSGLASALVEAFEGKIDFKKDTRAGDSFRLVVDEQFVEGKSFGYGPVLAVEYRGERCGTAQS